MKGGGQGCTPGRGDREGALWQAAPPALRCSPVPGELLAGAAGSLPDSISPRAAFQQHIHGKGPVVLRGQWSKTSPSPRSQFLCSPGEQGLLFSPWLGFPPLFSEESESIM